MNILLTSLFFLQATQPAQPTQQEMQAMAQSARSVMFIDPKARANDYVQAFDILRQEKSIAKVQFVLADGTKIANVIELRILPNNTLLLFRYNTTQGIKLQVVEIENLVGILF